MNTTIYIFGNLPVFQAALTGLQMIFNPANNTDWAVGGSLFGVGPVVEIGLLISLLHITTKGVWTQKMSLHHVGIMLGLYAAMFIPTTSVQVQDIYTGQTVIVDKIPIGVAYPAAIVSQLSYDAATQLGQAFQMATATAPTTDISQGFAEPLQQMLQMRHLYQNYVKTATPLADAEFSFFQQCVYPVYSSDTTLQAAYNETNNILATVTNTNYVTASGANMMVNVLGGTGNPICGSSQGCLLTCNGLASTLNTQYAQWKSSSGSGSCTAAVAMAAADKSDTVKPPSSCTTAASNLGNVLAQLGTTGDQYIDQMVHGCMASAGMSAGGSLFAGEPSMSVLPSYCVITQNSLSQAQVDNAGAASMFLKNMLPLMSVLQFLFIAMAPLAAFTMVMAGAQGMGMFVKYIMFGLWTQSWLPVAAMLNDYSQITLAHKLGVLGQAVTGVSANITAAATSVTLASMPPPPANGLTLTTLPTVIESTMQALSNADMLLALTPIITMIVFTGSYMGMAQLAQDMGGEDKVGKNAEAETPSIGTQVKAFGVSAPGNASGSYMVTDGATAGLGYSIGNTASLASTAAQSTAATATQTASTATSHAANMTYGALSQHGVDQTAAWKSQDQGAQEVSTAFKHAQDFQHSTGVSMDKAFAMQAAYEGALKIPGMTPESAWKSVASGAFSGIIGGLIGAERDELKKGIQNKDVQGWENTLSSGEAAKFVSSVSRENGKAISQKESDKVDQSVSDAQNAQVTAQNAVSQAAKVEQQASMMRSVGGNAKVDQASIASHFANIGQPLTSHAAQIMASRAGGHEAVVALNQAEDQLKSRGLQGQALYAAALTKIGMMNPETGLGIASQIYGDMGPGLKGMGAVQQGAQEQIHQTQGQVDKAKQDLAPAAKHAKQAETTADKSKDSGAAHQGVPTITDTSPTTDPHAFAAQGQGRIIANHQGDVAPTQAFHDGMAAVNDAPGMDMLSKVSPYEFLGLLAGGNAVSGALKDYAQHQALKRAEARMRGKTGEGNKGGGEAPDKPGAPPDGKPAGPGAGAEAPGSSAPVDPPGDAPDGKPAAAEGAGGAEPAKGAAPVPSESPASDYAARQQAARDALNPVQRAETAATDAAELAEKRALAKTGAEAALSVADQTVLQEAKQAVLKAGEKFAAKTAAGTAIAAGAGSTGLGAPIAGVIEVANVAMNVDAAVDVAQALYTYAKTPGASEEVVSALQSTANSIMKQAGQPIETNVPNVMP